MIKEFKNKEYNVNAHPYKGTYKLNEEEIIDAFFFDARILPTKPLRAFIIYTDSYGNTNILNGSNNIEDIRDRITSIKDPTEEEINKEYIPMIIDYVTKNNINIDSVPNQYVEDSIAQYLNNLNNTYENNKRRL